MRRTNPLASPPALPSAKRTLAGDLLGQAAGAGQLTAKLAARGRRLLARRLRGSVLDASCMTLGAPVQGSTPRSGSSMASRSVESRGHVSYEFVLDVHADFCDDQYLSGAPST